MGETAREIAERLAGPHDSDCYWITPVSCSCGHSLRVRKIAQALEASRAAGRLERDEEVQRIALQRNRAMDERDVAEAKVAERDGEITKRAEDLIFHERAARQEQPEAAEAKVLDLCGLKAQHKEEVKFFETCGIIELAIRNINVDSYMRHWEKRAEAAEAKVAELEGALRKEYEEAIRSGKIVVQFAALSEKVAQARREGILEAELALHVLWASASSPWRNEREEACAAIRALVYQEEEKGGEG